MALRSALIVFIACWLSARLGIALDAEYTRHTLKEVTGVYVLLEELHPDAEQVGLTNTAIRTDVELKLRLAGIRVLSRAESSALPDDPVLYINVDVMEISIPGRRILYLYHVLMEFSQRAVLVRDPGIVADPATTWSVNTIAYSSESGFPDHARDQVTDLVDMFINAYLSANPRE